MAACKLRVELVDPQDVYRGGETVQGRVHVEVTKDVNCKKLTVATRWKTHGRGNVASQDCEKTIPFTGTWRAGEQVSYPFALTVGGWPPSYHGHYLNLDHYVEADADIPWAFDPKASATIVVRPTKDDPAAKAKNKPASLSPVIVKKIGLSILGGFVAFSLMFPPLLLILIPVALIGVPIYMFFVFLPKWVLGAVELNWDSTRIAPGQSVTGTLTLSPKRNVQVNGIALNLTGSESCVSGSGTNTTTHTHKFFDEILTISPATTLQSGQPNTFDIRVSVPADAPYSMEVTSNKLLWSMKTRVDLPRWPDWKQTDELEVVPTPEGATSSAEDHPAHERSLRNAPATASSSDPAGGVSFGETMMMIQSAGSNLDEIEMIVEALRGIPIDAVITADRRLLYAGDEESMLRRGENAWWAVANQTHPPVRLTVFVSDSVGQRWTDDHRDDLSGPVEILGYDSKEDRLRIRWLGD